MNLAGKFAFFIAVYAYVLMVVGFLLGAWAGHVLVKKTEHRKIS